MGGWVWLGVFGGLVLLAGLAVPAGRWLRRAGREIQSERARETFALEHERLAEQFRAAASAAGKPRGLRWVRCDLGTVPTLARDRQTGRLIALVPVTIYFEAVTGSDMEELPAVGLPRDGTALFAFRAGRWETGGRAVFNLGPEDVLARFPAEFGPE